MRKTLAVMTMACALAASGAAVADNHKTLFGTLGGAALGGLVGSQFGSGSGKLVATGAGVFLGGLLGREVGRSLDNADRAALSRSQHQALEYTPSGQAVTWQNPDSGHSGVTVPQPAYQNYQGQYCREFTQSVTVGGQTSQAYGTACRQADGTWRIVGQ